MKAGDETWHQRVAFQAYRSVAWLGRTLPERRGGGCIRRLGLLAYRRDAGVARDRGREPGAGAGRRPSTTRSCGPRRARPSLRYARYWFDTFHRGAGDRREMLDASTPSTSEHIGVRSAGRDGRDLCAPAHGELGRGRSLARRATGHRLVSVAERLEPPPSVRPVPRPSRGRWGCEIIGRATTRVGQQLAASARREPGGRPGGRPRSHRAGRGGEDVRHGARAAGGSGAARRSRPGRRSSSSPSYQTEDGWRCVFGAPLTIEPTGTAVPTSWRLTEAMAARLRAGDRRGAAGLARVPARRGRAVRIALVCPYAWDDPGGVQTHVRELARAAPATAATRWSCSRRSALKPSQPWVRPVGSPVDIPYNASNAPIDPRPVVRAVRSPTSSVASAPTSCTSTSRSPRARRCGPRSTSPVPGRGDLPLGREPLAALRPRGAGAAPGRAAASRSAIAVSEAAAGVRPARASAGRSRSSRTASTWSGSPTAVPADLGPGTKLLFVGRLDERKGFPTAVAAFARLAAIGRDLRLVVAGDGPDRARPGHASTPAVRARVTMLGRVPNGTCRP